MDDSDSATPLTLEDLIAFGADYLELLKEPGSIRLGPPALAQQFLKAAVEALQRQRDQTPKRQQKKGGRPPGGMREQMLRLTANGVPEPDALRITQRQWGKDYQAVLRAQDRASKSKKPPTRRKRAAKNPL